MKIERLNRSSVHIALLLLTILIFYSHTFDAGFMFDDYAQQFMLKLIKNNEREVNIFNFVRTTEEVNILTEMTAIPWWTAPQFRIRYFRPVATLIHLFDYSLWNGNSLPYHVQNVIWYTVLVILLYFFYNSFCAHSMMAFCGAMVFAIEPCHYMTVRWIANRNDIICATFLVASFIFYLKFCKQRRLHYGVLSLLSYLLALLSKELAFPFPVLLFTFDWIRYKNLKDTVRYQWKVYFALIMINSIHLLYYKANGYGSYWYGENILRDYPFDFIKATSLYLGSIFYGYVIAGLPPYFFTRYWFVVVPQLIFLFFIGYLIWKRRKEYPEIPLFILWIVLLLPFIVIPPLNDRLLLIPSIGYAYLVALAICKIGKKWLTIFFILFALLLPPIINGIQAKVYDEAVQLNDERLYRALDEIIPHKTDQDRLFFINFPSIGLAGENYMYLVLYLNLIYHYPQWGVPVYSLTAFDTDITVQVLDSHHVRIFHPTRFYFETNLERLFSLNRFFSQGEIFSLPEVTITIDEVYEGKVKSIVAEFSKPIDDPYYYFLFFDEGRWQRWNPHIKKNPFSKG